MTEKPILLRGVRLPSGARLHHNGESAVMVGSHLKSGFFMEGIIKEMREHGDKVLITLENGDQMLLYSTGMLAEVASQPKEKAR